MTAESAAPTSVPRLAEGVELLGYDPDEDRWLARRPDGRVVRMPWLLHRVASLLDGERDLAGVAAVIREEDDAAVTEEEVRVVVARRLVPAGLVVGPADEAPAPAVGAARGRSGSRRAVVASLVLAALVLVAGTAALTLLVVGPRAVDVAPAAEDTAAGPPAASAPAAVTAPGGVTGPPTLFGRVVEVPDATSAVVDVGGRPVRVDVAGLAADVPACATADARAFAQETLGDQEVTVVPDPTLPPGPAGRYRAYLVLGSQLSYTDAALRAGWAKAGEGRYRDGFVEGQRAAESARLGQWGPPCRVRR